MPMYEFLCVRCGKLYEIIVKLDKLDKDVECPHCKSKLEKLISPIHFKMN